MKHLIMAMICVSGVGCSSYQRPEPVYGVASTVEQVQADYDDVRAAVLATVRDIDMVVVEDIIGDQESVFVLRCRNDEPAKLIATRMNSSIQLAATVGRFGDGAAQRDLIRGVAMRLRALSGRDHAPLRGYP
jgi:hypothetical protein